jgi:hypothetical protein
MNHSGLVAIQKLYTGRAEDVPDAVGVVINAVLRLECRSLAVEVALDALVALHEATRPVSEAEIMLTEQYVLGIWALYKPPAVGVYYKGAPV